MDKRTVILGHPGDGRALAFDCANDCKAQAVEGADRNVLCCILTKPFANPLFHLLPGIPCEGQQQQFGGMPIASLQQPARFGRNHRGLAAAGRSDDQVSVIIDDDGLALFFSEGPFLNPIE